MFQKNSKFNNGFTLTELIVAVGIITLISTVVLAKYPDLSKKQSIDRAARFVSLSLRDAQTKSLSVKEESVSGKFPAYGIRFENSFSNKIILFADLDCVKNSPELCVYNNAAGDKKVEEKIISGTARIVDLCGNKKSGVGAICGLTNIDVVFLRPASSIYLRGNNGASVFKDAEIIIDLLGTNTNRRRTVGITENGQFFIE